VGPILAHVVAAVLRHQVELLTFSRREPASVAMTGENHFGSPWAAVQPI